MPGGDEQEFVVVDDTGIGRVRFVLPDGRRHPTLHVDLADPGSGEMIPLATVVMGRDDWHRGADLTQAGTTSASETGWVVTRASAGLAVPGDRTVSSATAQPIVVNGIELVLWIDISRHETDTDPSERPRKR